MNFPLYSSRGIRLVGHKNNNSSGAISLPLQEKYFLPMKPDIAYQILYKVGEPILGGALLALPDCLELVAIRAPTSGTISAICDSPALHESGWEVPSIEFLSDGQDRFENLEFKEPTDWLMYLRQMGIVGLGGAAFPSHRKIPKFLCKILIINGVECEPHISCDDYLMRYHAEHILKGVERMKQLLGAKECYFGIEDNKPEALETIRDLASDAVRVVSIPTLYPNGSAKQLVRILLGIEVPQAHHLSTYGLQCFNVGTMYALADALESRPLLERLVTVTGHVEKPGNYWVRLGTSVADLLQEAGAYPDHSQVVVGGPMMGFKVSDYRAPVTAEVNCLLVYASEKKIKEGEEQPCIRCTKCVDVCPAELQPHELYWWSRARNWEATQKYYLFDCIECGCCSYVCPSQIPLVDYYRHAKSEIRHQEKQTKEAQKAKDNYEKRLVRLERLKKEREDRVSARMKKRLSEEKEEENRKLIQGALERIRDSEES